MTDCLVLGIQSILVKVKFMTDLFKSNAIQRLLENNK